MSKLINKYADAYDAYKIGKVSENVEKIIDEKESMRKKHKQMLELNGLFERLKKKIPELARKYTMQKKDAIKFQSKLPPKPTEACKQGGVGSGITCEKAIDRLSEYTVRDRKVPLKDQAQTVIDTAVAITPGEKDEEGLVTRLHRGTVNNITRQLSSPVRDAPRTRVRHRSARRNGTGRRRRRTGTRA